VITLEISILFLCVLILCLLALLVVGVGRLRDDFKLAQTMLFRIEWHTDPGKKGKPGPWKADLQKWLDKNPDRPRKDDPPFVK
jgi:hypothetical protein